MTSAALPVSIHDEVNAAILAVSEDRITGFHRRPLDIVAEQTDLPLPVVIERIRAMLEAGTIRRVRQTLLATSLAEGALVAWKVPAERLDAAFEFMSRNDPFSGHVVLRSTDAAIEGAAFRLWTTLKVPQGFSIDAHARYLAGQVGATDFRLMPARRLFVLGVGHTRRRGMDPGSKADVPAEAISTAIVKLSADEWQVLTALKREFRPEEIVADPWVGRAQEAGVSLDHFLSVADRLNERGIVGRFSTFLEHVKPLADGERVTRYNALFHWAVPAGREIEAGREVGRHHVLTHAYWREAGPEFGNVNVMAVAHGTEKSWLLEHKAAIDAHLEDCGIPVSYTNVFWGGRSEIKPSEVSPIAYEGWCRAQGIDPAEMRPPGGEPV